MYLSSFALIEPEDKFYFYQPSWLNAREANLYHQGLQNTHAAGWGFKRFGTDPEIYPGEMIRNPKYSDYIEAIEQVGDHALQSLSPKERVKLLKSRTAFIYADSWGESGLFENTDSALHISMIDTLPKNLVKKFAISEPTCKIRGEKQAFTQAMRVAQDYLRWDVFDYVVICAAYRAVLSLVFSDEGSEHTRLPARAKSTDNLNLTVERTGCFIFSQHKSDIRVSGNKYVMADKIEHTGEIDQFAFAGLRKDLLIRSDLSQTDTLDLVDIYGNSGCLTPALSFEYLNRHPLETGKLRTIIPDRLTGYSYFDIEFCKE